MNNSNTISCQTCLGQLELPINLFESSYSDFLDVLQRLLTFQVYVEGKQFSVCLQCQRKLKWIFEFQNICLKSLETLRSNVKIEQSSSSDNNDDCLLQSVTEISKPRSLAEEDDRSYSPLGDSDSDYHSKKSNKKRNEKIAKKCRKQRNAALQAIDELDDRKTAFKNKQCVYCDFVGRNAVALLIHMKRRHRYVKNWCELCNAKTEDLQEHRNALRCHIWRCKFCEKEFVLAKKLRRHLKICRVGHCKVNAEVTTTFLDIEESNHSFIDLIQEESNQQTPQSLPNKDKRFEKRCRQFPLSEVLQVLREVNTYRFDMKNRQCIFCEFIGEKAVALQIHMKRKHGGNMYTWCPKCNIQVDDLQKHKDSLRCHIWKCKLCNDFGSKKATTLFRHLRLHGGIEKANAQVKDYVRKRYDQYSNEEVLRAIEDCKTKRTSCVHCSHNSSSATRLAAHMRTAHQSFMDSWCKGCNIQTEDLKHHKVASKCMENSCVFCKRKFEQTFKLVQHLKKHCLSRVDEVLDKNAGTSNKSLKQNASNALAKLHLCPYCGKTFSSLNKLKYHASNHSGKKSYKCSICGKSYRNAHVLRSHKQQHGSFVCHICGKRSSSKVTHKAHMGTHETGGPAQCTVCDKMFVRPGRLKLHMKEHSGENQCIVCGKSFRMKYLLVTHMRVHNDERPFKCNFCGKGFNNKDTCIKHEQIHTGEKPFKCLICPYSAIKSFALTTHMKQHPEDAPQASKPHKCLLCHRSFSTNSVLLSHIDFIHGKNSNM